MVLETFESEDSFYCVWNGLGQIQEGVDGNDGLLEGRDALCRPVLLYRIVVLWERDLSMGDSFCVSLLPKQGGDIFDLPLLAMAPQTSSG